MKWQDFESSKSKADALQFLQDSGWEITKSRFYNHCGDGKLTLSRDGVYTWRALKKYAEAYLVRTDTGETVSETGDRLAEKKQRLEIEQLEIKIERAKFEQEVERGNYLPKADIYRELVARAVVLDSGLTHLIRSKSAELIARCKGDQSLLPEVIEDQLEAKDKLMNSFARLGEFEIELPPLADVIEGE
jgi:hypothetical protein